MSLFTKPISDIEFSDVEAFCDEWPEGARVEYKKEIPKAIPKIVSSFANTLGGVLVIGAEADKVNNKVTSLDGIPKKDGIEEGIVQSALTGIYPGVIPTVKIVEMPESGSMIVVVRVEESAQAPHMIQNSKRVYERAASVSHPHEWVIQDAGIHRIEYLLRRRQDSTAFAQQILKRIEDRVESLFKIDMPNITAVARPTFPYRPLIAPEAIYKFAQTGHSRVDGSGFAHWYCSFRTAGGFRASSLMDHPLGVYWEMNEYGIVYNREEFNYCSEKFYEDPVIYDGEQRKLLHSSYITHVAGGMLSYAAPFFRACNYTGNIDVSVRLRNVFKEFLFYNRHPDLFHERIPSYYLEHLGPRPYRCHEPEISSSVQCLAKDLLDPEKMVNVVDQLTAPLLWAFNVDVDPEERRTKVESILTKEGFLPGSAS